MRLETRTYTTDHKNKVLRFAVAYEAMNNICHIISNEYADVVFSISLS